MFTKWAPEMLIDRCSHILINEKEIPITAAHKKKILAQNEKFAKSALRVLWFAYKKTAEVDMDENNLVFVWLQAMIDHLQNILTIMNQAKFILLIQRQQVIIQY